ncbi:hypothetical protein GCM10022297_15840 [Lactobacillus hamsteri]|uniref:Addiction module antitoxin, RelB DinJ family n=1 Tax=Lactobacillus hamsteri DSM 5661 = JCM 6256 TaxID=1423754 RepID=A0A0R1YLN4_9LACO|nr:type II toxin-antitoxin system RelB/DinJ family antitoxin [Lactobacillus hamsteri]KRM40777.1 hypothetical protein FC39_GL000109 [Lactobacillus hamsteri DSM 5661 = JCM 6256]
MATIQITLDDKEKEKVDVLFKQLGMTTSGAIKIFLSQSLQNQGLPFTPQLKKHYHEIKAIHPQIAKDGSLIIPDDAPQDIKDWINNG